MNDINLYEKIPYDEYQIRILEPSDSSKMPPHWHEHTEIHFIVSGTLKMRCGEKILTLHKNDCAVINPNELHEGLDGKDCMSFKIILPPSFFANHYAIFESFIQDSKIIGLFHKILECYKSEEASERFKVKGYTYLLISHLCKHHTERSLSEYNYQIYNEKLNKINTAVKYISNHYAEEISAEALAKTVHLSQSHFCHIFKDVFGMSAKEYLISIRIQKACELLRTSSMSVTDIAFNCGFTDANYFARAFRKLKGISPSEYKKEKRKKISGGEK